MEKLVEFLDRIWIYTRSEEWSLVDVTFKRTLITGEKKRGYMMSRVAHGRLQYRAATDEEVAEFHDGLQI